MEEEMIGIPVHNLIIVFAPCVFMQESVAGGRQCVAVSLELVLWRVYHILVVSSNNKHTVILFRFLENPTT